MIGKEQDFELLSAYIDGELTEAERGALEARLRIEPDLQAEFAALQHTITLIRQLPLLNAPRNYTLNPAQVQRPKVVRPRWGIWASAVAAMLVAVFGLIYFLTQSGQDDSSETTASQSDIAQVQATSEETLRQETTAQTTGGEAVNTTTPAAPEVAMAAIQPTATTIPLQTLAATATTIALQIETSTMAALPSPTIAQLAAQSGGGGGNQPAGEGGDLIPDSMMPPAPSILPPQEGGAGGGGGQEFEQSSAAPPPGGIVGETGTLPQDAQRATQLGTEEQDEDAEADPFASGAVEAAPMEDAADAASEAEALPGAVAPAPNAFKVDPRLGRGLIRLISGLFHWLG